MKQQFKEVLSLIACNLYRDGSFSHCFVLQQSDSEKQERKTGKIQPVTGKKNGKKKKIAFVEHAFQGRKNFQRGGWRKQIDLKKK